MSQRVRTAVLPVGGLGTRFLPATKAVPKEMLPVVDRPRIQYAVDEARAAGIEKLVVVTGRGGQAIENYLGPDVELGKRLVAKGKRAEIAALAVEFGSGPVTSAARAELDAGFFRVRMDRTTDAQRAYLSAMADMGPGPHRSGDVAQALGKRTTQVGPVRHSLIQRGLCYSPRHDVIAFTVPMFDEFIRRHIA